MDYFKILAGRTRACINKYDMIGERGKAAVGLSGGADSMMLLCVLSELSKYCPQHFSVCAITVDMGFEDLDISPCIELCEKLGVEYKIVRTEIKKAVFDKNSENPCLLCSKMRRRALCDAAIGMGADTLALGHNEDDAAQTLLMNLLYGGNFISFSPVTDYGELKLIRPFVSSSEKLIRQASEQLSVSCVSSPCPYDKKTRREDMKKIIASVDSDSRGTAHRLINALEQHEIDGYKK